MLHAALPSCHASSCVLTATIYTTHRAKLVRVLRGCANYDEIIMDKDPLVHYETMLEGFNFVKNQSPPLCI
ncbi:hypothetical protein PPTG_21962 [Phytophthora nicotianae INRA-310]|uniref:Uncharacterized protein n=1 Tax=Phytophthora nicotianae (strain INRA-310) TaxID=761204 RepID=W2QSV1_PHYN3|nr:hypothetical protein PPTG_21962 [Phytophthora nicotianae INRA-310]ETN15574.1 hypothetical protein PPTG_21962 [Phytophthora nicotianae INRA-310]